MTSSGWGGAARQGEEHVVKGCGRDRQGLDRDLCFGGFVEERMDLARTAVNSDGDRPVALVGPDDTTVEQPGRPGDPHTIRKHKVEPLARHPGLERGGRPLCHDAAVIEEGDPVSQPIRLLEVLGRQQDRRPRSGQVAHRVPQTQAAARIEAGRRLVKEQDGRLDHEAGGQVQATAHAARPCFDQSPGGIGKIEPIQQLVSPVAGRFAARVETAAPIISRFSRPVCSSSTAADWPVRLIWRRTASGAVRT